MSSFLRQGFPIALQGSVGSTLSLSSLLTQAYGENAGSITGVWLGYYGAAALHDWNSSYVDPSLPSVSTWRLNGSALPISTSTSFNQTFVSAAQFAETDVQLGNMFAPALYMTVRIDNGAADPVFIQYDFTTDTSISLIPPNRAPTPSEIVSAAETFVTEHPNIPNSNDCHYISMLIGASVGATMSDDTASLIPTDNVEGGFWRIAYRGTSATPHNWLSLTQPGDIVRFDWADPSQSQHTTLITGHVQPDGGVFVVDNAGSIIHEHVAYYDQISTASTITIYRVTTDNLYLIQTTDAPETVLGTKFNDLIRAGGGDDIIKAGVGNDVIDGGYGNDEMYGGLGNDTYLFNSPGDKAIELRNQGIDTISSSVSLSTLPVNVENAILTGYGWNSLVGSTAWNVLTGNSGNNTLSGGLGNDTLIGKLGKDTLTGGGGLDKMVFETLADSGVAFSTRDVINTFAHGDKIDVSAIDANSTVAGNQPFTFVDHFSHAAGQLQWDLTGISTTGVKGYLVQGDVNGDGAADFSLQIYTAPTAHLPGGPNAWHLAAFDFVL
ncbi:hypothetical protein [Bradyrhizobium sp. USDA 4518]